MIGVWTVSPGNTGVETETTDRLGWACVKESNQDGSADVRGATPYTGVAAIPVFEKLLRDRLADGAGDRRFSMWSAA